MKFHHCCPTWKDDFGHHLEKFTMSRESDKNIVIYPRPWVISMQKELPTRKTINQLVLKRYEDDTIHTEKQWLLYVKIWMKPRITLVLYKLSLIVKRQSM